MPAREKILTTDFTNFADGEKAPHEFIPFPSREGRGTGEVKVRSMGEVG
jgi:hypothetical protein